MNLIIRWILIIFLLSISLLASLFIVIESGTFYQQFYNHHLAFFHMGYWAALLNELFMAIMAAAWLPAIATQKKVKTHPANFLFKFLLAILFVTTVGGASFNSVIPLIKEIQIQDNNSKIISIIETQVDDNNRSFKTFSSQNQKTNTAITARNQVVAKEELKLKIGTTENTLSLWLQVFFIVLLRLGVQLANLCCVWLAGWIFRNGNSFQNKFISFDQPKNKIINPLTHSLSSNWIEKTKSIEVTKNKIWKNPQKNLFNDSTDVAAYREKIRIMTEKILLTTSLSTCCKQLGVNAHELNNILNHNLKFNSSYIPLLKSIYEKFLIYEKQKEAV